VSRPGNIIRAARVIRPIIYEGDCRRFQADRKASRGAFLAYGVCSSAPRRKDLEYGLRQSETRGKLPMMFRLVQPSHQVEAGLFFNRHSRFAAKKVLDFIAAEK
jgi:hypothetical protein